MFAKSLIPLFGLLLPFIASAQTKTTQSITLSGIVRDAQTGAALTASTVTVYDDMLKVPVATTKSNADGTYVLKVSALSRYRIEADQSTYFTTDSILSAISSQVIDLQLSRKPGYVFDMVIFDKAFDHNPINTLGGCKIEIYNNTQQKEELVIPRLEKATFHFSFAEGNHYTMLVRKPGYLNRRIELYVNVNGCILCVDGMGINEPDVVQLMSHDNQTGTFLGTVDLDSIQIGKRFQLNNVYYDFDKADIRPEAAKILDKLAVFLKDNPAIKVELGSHTDARGNDAYNLNLSDQRAVAAVSYLTSVHEIDTERITAKGYGETTLVNRCEDGISCSESEHQMNRRTEIKIIGLSNTDPLWEKSLKQIIEDPQLYRKIIQQEKSQKSFSARNK